MFGISDDNNKLWTTVYRKPTHTDRLLDQSSHTIERHTKPPPSNRWPDEHNLFATHLTLYVTKTTTYNACFTKIITSESEFVKLNTYRNNELNESDNPTTVTATIPYIKGMSEIISRILRPYNIPVHVARKPITTLRHIRQTRHSLQD